MENKFKQLQTLIKNHNQIAIFCHKKPDGDALGSLMAFVSYLEFLNKDVRAYCLDKAPAYLNFLSGIEKIKNNLDNFFKKTTLVIFVDCSDWKITGYKKDIFKNKETVAIDHHISNEGFAGLNLISSKSASTTELIFDFFSEINFNFDKKTATCLLAGLYTDTDAFSNLATTPKSFQVASSLLAKGGNLKEVAANTIQNKSITSLKLWGRALERLRLDKKKGVAITVIKQKDFFECKAGEDDAEGVANLLNNLADVKMAMVLREFADGTIKGSLRTTNELIDVAKIAKLLGGGGHKKAAGFTVAGKIVETENGWEII